MYLLLSLNWNQIKLLIMLLLLLFLLFPALGAVYRL